MTLQKTNTPKKYSHLLYGNDFRAVFDDFTKMILKYKKTFIKD
jgi:hypothetical protein